MKQTNYFELSTAELELKVKELKQELFNLRFKHATNQLPNPLVLNETKKDIARVKTILRQRELGISEEPAAAPKKSARTKAKKA